MSDMTDSKTIISSGLLQAQQCLERFIADERTLPVIGRMAQEMAECLRNGGKILSLGNGGSLCDATHFAEELTGRFRLNRRPYAAIAVNDPAFLTCTANDMSYEEAFERYVQALGKPGDVLLAISTSGASRNVNRAARKALEMGLRVHALTQDCGCELESIAHLSLLAPRAPHSDRIQEIHIKVIHLLIETIESLLIGDSF